MKTRNNVQKTKNKALKRAIRKIKAMKTNRLRVTSSTIKTKNENEMKTKNNVQKTILRFAAVVISFVLISFTVSAQDFWKRLIASSSFNEIAMAMVDHSKKVDHTTELAHANFDFANSREADKLLELEPWMMDNSNFRISTPSVIIEKDSPLQMESWMLDEKLFEVKGSEEKLSLENWMTSDFVQK